MTTLAMILDGLEERFRLVPGIHVIIRYEPTSVQDYPLLYSMMENKQSSGGEEAGLTWHYRILHRLVFRWQDNAGAAEELIPFVDAIPAAVDADPQLGGRLDYGYAQISEVTLNWGKIGGTDCLFLDFISEVATGEG